MERQSNQGMFTAQPRDFCPFDNLREDFNFEITKYKLKLAVIYDVKVDGMEYDVYKMKNNYSILLPKNTAVIFHQELNHEHRCDLAIFNDKVLRDGFDDPIIMKELVNYYLQLDSIYRLHDGTTFNLTLLEMIDPKIYNRIPFFKGAQYIKTEHIDFEENLSSSDEEKDDVLNKTLENLELKQANFIPVKSRRKERKKYKKNIPKISQSITFDKKIGLRDGISNLSDKHIFEHFDDCYVDNLTPRKSCFKNLALRNKWTIQDLLLIHYKSREKSKQICPMPTPFVTSDLKVKFTSNNDFVENMDAAWEIECNRHLIGNEHHPDCWKDHKIMSIDATVELMFDLWSCAMRETNSYIEAYDLFLDWIGEVGPHGITIRKKYEKLNPDGLFVFYYSVYFYGIDSKKNDKIKNAHKIRSHNLSLQARKTNWRTLYNENLRLENIVTKLYDIPEVRFYIKETRMHSVLVNTFLKQMSMKQNHDNDKFYLSSVIAYTWKWFIKDKCPITKTFGFKGLSECFTNLLNKGYNAYQSTVEHLIPESFKESCNSALESIEDIKAMFDSVKNKVAGFLEPLTKLFGTSTTLEYEKLFNLFKLYIVGINTTSMTLKIICFVSSLIELNILQNVVDVAKLYIEDEVKEPESIVQTNFATNIFFKIYKYFSEFSIENYKSLMIPLGILITLILGVTLATDKLQTYAKGFVDYMRNWHFIGAGFLGISRFFSSILGAIQYVVEIVCVKVFGKVPKEEKDKEDLKNLVTDFSEFVAKVNHFSTDLVLQTIATHQPTLEEAKKLFPIYIGYLKLKAEGKLNREMSFMLTSLDRKIFSIVNTISRATALEGFRRCPFHIQFCGLPGIGKSHLINTMIKKLKERFFPECSNIMYARGNTDHWDGYKQQPVVIYDDIFSINDYKMGISELLSIVSNVPVHVPMANLEEKGTLFTSDFLISTTNTPFPQIHGIYNLNAIYRRRHLLVQVNMDPKVKSEMDGAFDMKLFKQHYPKADPQDYPHLTFTFIDPLKNEILKQKIPNLDPPLEDLSFDRFIFKVLNYSEHKRKTDASMTSSPDATRREQINVDLREIDNIMKLLENDSIPPMLYRNFAFTKVQSTTQSTEPNPLVSGVFVEETKAQVAKDLTDSLLDSIDKKFEELINTLTTVKRFSLENFASLSLTIYETLEILQSSDESTFKERIKRMKTIMQDLKNIQIIEDEQSEPKTFYQHLLEKTKQIGFNRNSGFAFMAHLLGIEIIFGDSLTKLTERMKIIPTSGNELIKNDKPADSVHKMSQLMATIDTSKTDICLDSTWTEGSKYINFEILFEKNFNLLVEHVTYLGHSKLLSLPEFEYLSPSILIMAKSNAEQYNIISLYKYANNKENIFDIFINAAKIKNAMDLFVNERYRPEILSRNLPNGQIPKMFCNIDASKKHLWPQSESNTLELCSNPILTGNFKIQRGDTMVDRTIYIPVYGKEINRMKTDYGYISFDFLNKLIVTPDGFSLYFDDAHQETDFKVGLSTIRVKKCVAEMAHAKMYNSMKTFTSLNKIHQKRLFNLFAESKAKWGPIFGIYNKIKETSIKIFDKIWNFIKGLYSYIKPGIRMITNTLIVYAALTVILYLIGQLVELIFPKTTSAPNPYGKNAVYYTSKETPLEVPNQVSKALTPAEIEGYTVNSFRIFPKMLLVPFHSVSEVSIGHITIHISPDVKYTYEFKKNNVIRIGSSDVALIHHENFPQWKDSRKYFYTEKDFETHSSENITSMYHLGGKTWLSTAPHMGIQPKVEYGWLATPQTYTNVIKIKTSMPRGSSGGLYMAKMPLSNHNRIIMGLQSHTDGKTSCGSLITQEALNQVIKPLTSVYPVLQELNIESLNYPTVTSCKLGEHMQIEGLTPLDKVIHIGNQSKIERTELFEQFAFTKVPSILSPKDERGVGDPAIHSLNKYGRDSFVEIPQRYIDKSVKERASWVRELIDFIPEIKTMEEAIEGYTTRNGVKMEHINLTTSPGIPYVYSRGVIPGKKSLVNIDILGKINYISDTLIENVNNTIIELKNGQFPPFMAMEVLKDELRPISKAYGLTEEQVEKWKEGVLPPQRWPCERTVKTRTITVIPFHLSIIYRMYCSDLFAMLRKHAGEIEYCIGINAENFIAFCIYDSMRILNDHGYDLDAQNWDGHYTEQLSNAFSNFVNLCYRRDMSKPTPEEKENEKLRKTLLSCLFQLYLQYKEIIIKKFIGQSSGDPATADKNTMGHIFAADAFWYEIMEENNRADLMHIKFKQHYTLDRFYGDDRFFVVSKLIENFYNGKSVAAKYNKYGWTITTAEKDRTPGEPVPLTQIKFLKRTFEVDEFDPFYVKWKLEPETITSLCQYMRKSPTPRIQFASNIETALDFATDHGREYFDRLVAKIRTLHKKTFPVWPILDYDYYYEIKKRRYFGDQSVGLANLENLSLLGIK